LKEEDLPCTIGRESPVNTPTYAALNFLVLGRKLAAPRAWIDTELMVRIWDVASDGSVQGLVTRGAYRSLDGPGEGLAARFQIAANGYRFAAGHSLKLEVTANDAPYYQPSNVPAAVRIDAIELLLPTR
jgi:predicted acyl esterase